MLNIFRGLLKDKPSTDQIVKENVPQETSQRYTTYNDDRGNVLVNTYLSLNKNEANILKLKKDLLEEDVKALVPLKQGEIDLKHNYFYFGEEGLEVNGFVRNGLDQSIRFQDITLAILNQEGKVVGQQLFDLSELGELPPGGVRPCKLIFSMENVSSKELSAEECQIVFRIEGGEVSSPTPMVSKLRITNIPEDFTDEERSELENYVNSLPEVSEGEVNIAGIEAQYFKNEEQEALITVIIFRNATPNSIEIGAVNLALVDEEGNIIAQGMFDFGDAVIEGNSGYISRLVFEKETFKFEGEPSFSTWAIKVTE